MLTHISEPEYDVPDLTFVGWKDDGAILPANQVIKMSSMP